MAVGMSISGSGNDSAQCLDFSARSGNGASVDTLPQDVDGNAHAAALLAIRA